jgi:hypothetical protein
MENNISEPDLQPIIQQLSFLKRADWQRQLVQQINSGEQEIRKWEELLVGAGSGIAECMDERPSL